MGRLRVWRGGAARGRDHQPLPRARRASRWRGRAVRCGSRDQRRPGRARVHLPRARRQSDAIGPRRSAHGGLPHGAAHRDADEAARFLVASLTASQPPRELRLEAIATGPSVVASLWDSGSPLAVEAEQRLTSPFRFTQSGGGGEVEFALARALAQSAGGSLRLRPRGGGAGAEVVATLPRSVLGAQTPLAAPAESLPRLRILVVDDDAVNRQAMVLLLEREGHQVVAVENGLEAMERLGNRDNTFDAIVTDLQMPRLGGRAMYEQLVNSRPLVAKRFVFVTGDQARGETRAFLENCGQPSVTKPYDLGDLIHAIGTVSRKK